MVAPLNPAILTRFEDALGKWREAPPETIAAIEASMGKSPREPEEPVLVVRCGQRHPLHRPAQITLEDGAVLSVNGALPADLPAGYHNLRYLDQDRDTMLIVSPGVCYFPEDCVFGVGRRSSMRCDPPVAGASATLLICGNWAVGRASSAPAYFY